MTALLRLAAFVAIGMTTLAIGLARFSPPETNWRLRGPARWVDIRDVTDSTGNHGSQWLDLTNGSVSAMHLPDGEVLENASCAPWMDDQGRSEVLGRWARWSGSGPQAVVREFGLARCSFPDGQVLERINTEHIPVHPPCWDPSGNARVVYAAADGRLYQFDFKLGALSSHSAADVRQDAKREPRPIEWHLAAPKSRSVFVYDPTWPDIPALRGYLVVSLRVQPELDVQTIPPARLWWLKLSESGDAIESAGPLLADRSDTAETSTVIEERCPVIAPRPGGGQTVAYLTRRSSETTWDLRMANLEIDPATAEPRLTSDSIQVLALGCVVRPPAFQVDGHRLFAVRHTGLNQTRLISVPVETGVAPPPLPIAHIAELALRP